MLPVLLIADNIDRINSYIAALLQKEQIVDVFYYGEKETILIDTIREINHTTQQPAFRKRGFILYGFDKVKKEGQNALLKTLEERNEENIFVMVASDEYKILSTILSRSRVERLYEHDNDDSSLLDLMALFDTASSQNILLTTQALSKGDHAEAIHQLRTHLHRTVHSPTIDGSKRASIYSMLELISEVENQLKNNIYPEFTLDYLLLRLNQSKLIPLPKVDDN